MFSYFHARFCRFEFILGVFVRLKIPSIFLNKKACIRVLGSYFTRGRNKRELRHIGLEVFIFHFRRDVCDLLVSRSYDWRQTLRERPDQRLMHYRMGFVSSLLSVQNFRLTGTKFNFQTTHWQHATTQLTAADFSKCWLSSAFVTLKVKLVQNGTEMLSHGNFAHIKLERNLYINIRM